VKDGRPAPPDLDDYRAIREALVQGLAGPLPGVPAQLRMAPSPRPGWRPGVFPEDARPAGVLVLLHSPPFWSSLDPLPPPWFIDPALRDTGCWVMLTRRTATVGRHAGQVSFPGGEAEPGESPREAALREAAEEIGVDPERIQVLGELTPLHVPVSGFVLHPVVAFAWGRPRFSPDPREVAELFDASLANLGDPANQLVETWRLDGRDYRVPFFEVYGEIVWGATAMILAELLTLLGHPPAPRETGRRRDPGVPPGGGVAPPKETP